MAQEQAQKEAESLRIDYEGRLQKANQTVQEMVSQARSDHPVAVPARVYNEQFDGLQLRILVF